MTGSKDKALPEKDANTAPDTNGADAAPQRPKYRRKTKAEAEASAGWTTDTLSPRRRSENAGLAPRGWRCGEGAAPARWRSRGKTLRRETNAHDEPGTAGFWAWKLPLASVVALEMLFAGV